MQFALAHNTENTNLVFAIASSGEDCRHQERLDTVPAPKSGKLGFGLGHFWRRLGHRVAHFLNDMRPVISSTALRRPVARHSFRSHLFRQTRFTSSSANTASTGAEKKAQDTLGNLGKNAERLWEGTKTFLGPVGERVGNMLGGA